MKYLYLIFLYCAQASAQCPEFTLANLQSLQRSTDKESKIRELGFDLHSEFNTKNATMRRYNKCWKGNAATPVYEQVIFWNTAQDQVMLLLFDNNAYQNLRAAIEERHNSAEAVKSRDYYIGKMFKYVYSLQKIDGLEYFNIAISFK
jgi:hypothetical protein